MRLLGPAPAASTIPRRRGHRRAAGYSGRRKWRDGRGGEEGGRAAPHFRFTLFFGEGGGRGGVALAPVGAVAIAALVGGVWRGALRGPVVRGGGE